MGLSSYFFPSSTSSSDLNLKRSTTIESSSSSHGHGSSSTRSSTSTLPTSASFSNLLGFDAAKDYLWPEATVFYPPSSNAKTVREAKEGAGYATDDWARATTADPSATTTGTRTRSRASSTASTSSSIAGIVARAGFGSSLSLYTPSSDKDVDTDTLRGRGRRKSISTPSADGTSFAETVRTHRRSRSATPSDKTVHRVAPTCVSSGSTANGFKILSPLPELPHPSTRPSSSSSMHTVTTPTRASFARRQTSPLERRTTEALTEDGETDEDLDRGERDIFLGSLKFGNGNRSELSLASSSGSGPGGRPSSPTKRALQGRRSAGMRSYGVASDASGSSTPNRYTSTPPMNAIELVVPPASPIPPKIELPPLPRSTTTSTFRPRSRRTLSLPFAPHLEPPSAAPSSLTGPGSSSSSVISASTSHRSPFFDPSSTLKADQPTTTVTAVAQPASLSTFSSWTFPPESTSSSIGEEAEDQQPQDRHRVLAPLRSYDLSSPATTPPLGPVRSSQPFPPIVYESRQRTSLQSPSSSSALSTSPSRRPAGVDRALSQPLVGTRPMTKSLSSSTSSSTSAFSSGSSPQVMGPPALPTGIRRATTLSYPTRPSVHQPHHHRPRTNSRSSSPAVTSPPMGSGAFSSSSSSGYGAPSSSYSSRPSRPQPKLRLPQSYSLHGLKDVAQLSDSAPLPYSRNSHAPSSPSGSSDGGGGQSDASIPWMALNHRRGSQSSQSSLRTEIRPDDHDEPHHPSSASSSSAGRSAGDVGQGRPTLWRSASSALSLPGMLAGLGRKSSLRESTTRKADEAVDPDETLGQAKGEESSDEEFVSYRHGL